MPSSSLNGRRLVLAGVIALTAILGTVYALVDPATAWWMPKCPVKWSTGFDCPGCGSQRAIHALLHGEFLRAFHENALLFFMIPFLALLAYAELTAVQHPRLHRLLLHPGVIIGVIVLILGWAVVRNLMAI